MIEWVLMAIILVGPVLYVLNSAAKMTATYRDRNEVSFSNVRRKEIEEERKLGRISYDEAEQLNLDLTLEERLQSQGLRIYGHDLSLAKRLLALMVICVSLGSVMLYQKIGFAREVNFTEQVKNNTMTPEALTAFLQFRAKKYERAEDWYYLAQDHLGREEYELAVNAFEVVMVKLPDDLENRADILVEYAQAVFYSNQQRVNDRMVAIIDQALALNANQATALGLKGVAEYEQRRYAEAVVAWQKAVLNTQDPVEKQALMQGIDRARRAGNISEKQIPSLITHRLRIALKVAGIDKFTQDDVLLVYAKSPQQPMPIAIQRVLPSQISQIIELTNLDNVMPGLTLAQADFVDVMVRLSNINSADLTQGKIVGTLTNVKLKETEILSVNVSL